MSKFKQTCLEMESLVNLYSLSISETHVQSLVIFGHVYDRQVKHRYFCIKHALSFMDLTFVMRYSFIISQPHTVLSVEQAAFQHNTSLKDSFLPIASYLHMFNLNMFRYMNCRLRVV